MAEAPRQYLELQKSQAPKVSKSMQTMAWMEGAGTLLEIYGMMESGRLARINAERAKRAHEFQAWQADRQGGIAIAISQRRALEEKRVGDVLASRALAVAAASGGGVSDPTVVKLMSDIEGEAYYRANVALYEGEAYRRQLRLDAAANRVTGSEKLETGLRDNQSRQIAAFGVGVRGAASLYSKFGIGGPGKGGDTQQGDKSLISDWAGRIA
jgi:hypothetical protein